MEDWVGRGKRGAAMGLSAERGGGSSREQAGPNSLTPASATTAPGHRLTPTHPAWSHTPSTLPTTAHGVYGTGGTLLGLGAP